jgi:hypothetical protein
MTELRPGGSLRGSPGAAPTIDRKVSETLGYTDEQAAEWIKTKLAGRQPSNVDAYLLRCLENHVAPTTKARAAKAARDSAPKAPAKKGTAKAGGKQPKKTNSKGGKFTCSNEGCGREFSSRSHSAHIAAIAPRSNARSAPPQSGHAT